MQKKSKLIFFLLFFTLIIGTNTFAADYGYKFVDDSVDTWGETNIVAISEEYSLVCIPFSDYVEEKMSAYSLVDVDLAEASAEDLYMEEGTITDIGLEDIFILETENVEYNSLTEAEVFMGDTLTVGGTTITVSSVENNIITFAPDTDICAGIFTADGDLIGITNSSTSGYTAGYLLECIAAIAGTDNVTDETDTSDEDSGEPELDFSVLESLIVEAKEIDTSAYSDTTEFDTAYTTAKTVYLTATSQEEIDSAVTTLQTAIDNLSTASSGGMIKLAVFAVVFVVFIVFIIYFFFIKKSPKKEKEQNYDQTGQDYGGRDYGDDYYTNDDIYQQSKNADAGRNQNRYPVNDEPPTSLLESAESTGGTGAYLIRKSTGEKISISNNSFSLGRGDVNYRITDNPTVGRNHCTIFTNRGDYYIQDSHSTNGTFVNGEKVDRYRLENADTILVSNEEFTFYLR